MNTINSVLMTFLVLIAVAALFLINFSTYFPFATSSTYIHTENIRGMAVKEHNMYYTLNFDQQNVVIEYVNQSVPAQDTSISSRISVQKILLYLFDDRPNQEISFRGVDREGNLLFSAPALYPKGLLKDTSNGAFQQLLSETYDS